MVMNKDLDQSVSPGSLIWGFDTVLSIYSRIKYLFLWNIYHKSSINMHVHVDQNLPFFVLIFLFYKINIANNVNHYEITTLCKQTCESWKVFFF